MEAPTLSKTETPYILIVDDDEDAREILGAILDDMTMSSRAAEDGMVALQVLKQHGHPMVILLDLMMPRMSGFELLSKLRAIPETRNIPVIVISAVDPNTTGLLLLPGIVDVMAKGKLTRDGVQEKVRGVLKDIKNKK